MTQAGQTLSSATAALRVKRETGEKALREFLGRVDQVNQKPYYLGKVVKVVLFGSMLKQEVARVSDVDVAVEIMPKEPDPERARVANYRRLGQLEWLGRRFRGFLRRELCWYWEVFGFLKGRSRVISLIDLRNEGEFVFAAPHKVLYEAGQWKADAPPRPPERHRPARRRTVHLADDDLF